MSKDLKKGKSKKGNENFNDSNSIEKLNENKPKKKPIAIISGEDEDLKEDQKDDERNNRYKTDGRGDKYRPNMRRVDKVKIMVRKETAKGPKPKTDEDKNNNNNNNKSLSKPFVSKKRGRPGKNSKKKIKDKKKGKYRPGNVCFKIYVSCMKNIHYFLYKKFKGLELHFPTVTNNKKKSHVAQRELFNKTIYELYCENQIMRGFKGRWKKNEKNKESKN